MTIRKCALVGAVILFYGMANPCVQAQDSSGKAFASGILYGIRIGLLAHDVGGLWSHSRAETGVDVNTEIVFSKPRLMLWQGLILPNIGVSINSRHDTSKVYAGLLWEWVFDNGFFVNSGGGLAVHNGQLESDDSNKKQLGSRVLFRVPVEFGFTIRERHRISILFDHMSNAYLATPNEGMDTIGVRYGFQF
ncbi:MAG: acyloxyacyl hydrolase [Deltaproteobacteria bacterium]|nr:acyloxyacyl hydrolase [Deltaproteobacteria bacterium]